MIQKKTFGFQLSWFLLTAIGLSIFISLGTWQLNRYFIKTQWLNHYETSFTTLSGKFMPGFKILIDNKTREGKAGYEVLEPFYDEHAQHLIFVSRGWVGQNISNRHPDRRLAPDLSTLPSDLIEISGSIYHPTKNKWIKDNIEMLTSHEATTYLRIQQFSQPLIQSFLQNKPLLLNHTPIHITDAILVLSPRSPHLLTPLPQPHAWLKPERHLGYALQWYLFAMISLFLYIRLSVIHKKSTTNT